MAGFRIYLSGGSSLPTAHTGDRLHSERPHSRGEERPGQYLQSGYQADSQTLSWNHHRDNNTIDWVWRARSVIIKHLLIISMNWQVWKMPKGSISS